MAGYTGLVRIIRRRLVLGLIFTLSFTYCAFSLFRNEVRSAKPQFWDIDVPNEAQNEEGGHENPLDVDLLSNFNDSESSNEPCRNSIQGKVLIVDEQGVVCSRHELLPNGCCNTEQKQTFKKEEGGVTSRKERYSCKTCNNHGCCAIYEYCVSCCLHPGKQIKGKKSTVESGKNNPKIKKEEETVKVLLRNMDRFQICLAACRTSSASVRHENTYKDPHSKHCYTVQPSYNYQRHRRDIRSLNNNRDNDAVVVTSSSVVQLIILNRIYFLSQR
ncbi:hypothetical protein M0802_007193 [Mischocyttarus mexicanus]|nr:hypothetical protein M0802_007193 [Mischocyttarus mexicanus]